MTPEDGGVFGRRKGIAVKFHDAQRFTGECFVANLISGLHFSLAKHPAIHAGPLGMTKFFQKSRIPHVIRKRRAGNAG